MTGRTNVVKDLNVLGGITVRYHCLIIDYLLNLASILITILSVYRLNKVMFDI